MVSEIGLVFDLHGKPIHWFGGFSAGAIPDSQSLWDVLWENRDRLGGVAHTHPWDGPAHPSGTDLTTFDAIERGLGKRLLWPIVTFTDMTFVVRNTAMGGFTYMDPGHVTIEIEGIEELRARSR